VVLRVEGSYYTINGGSLQIRGSSDDTIIIFGVTGSGVFGRAHNITDMKIQENFDAFIESEPLEFKVPMVCLVTGCVS
jgi:hypothetical protein